MTTWFTADQHFFHKNILLPAYEDRARLGGFQSVEDMNSAILEKWNERVKPDDTAYLLGDLAIGNKPGTTEILRQMNGQKHFILGNHDDLNRAQKGCFLSIQDSLDIEIEGMRVFMQHKPIFPWPGIEEGVVLLHGHTHRTSHADFAYPLKVNVGVDLWDFAPVAFHSILDHIHNKILDYANSGHPSIAALRFAKRKA